MEQLNSLSYLENVVREILRLYAPGPGTTRTATEDVVLPVSEPYLDQMGQKRSEIR
jgi:cytochrome P450